jgi:hypothetical protein
MKLKTLSLFSIAMLCSVLSVTTACTPAQVQEVTKIVTDTITLVQDAQTILETIDAAATVFFLAHPNPPLQAQYETAMGKCQAALTVAARVSQGSNSLTQDQADAAFSDFKAAYTALTTLLQGSGIMSSPNAMAAAPGQASIQVQTPLVMLKKK